MALLGLGIGVVSTSCGEDTAAGTGTLSLQGAIAAPSQKSITNTCVIDDLQLLIRQMWVSTDDIVEGQPDNLNWIEVYSADAAVPWADRHFDFDLPIGTYQSYKFIFGNTLVWVCDHDSTLYDLTDYMNSDLPPGDDVFGYNTPHGSYHLDESDNFSMAAQGEQVNPFDILEGEVTSVTWRWNVTGVDWIDEDDSGTWTDGDRMDNHTVTGSGSMWDFLIEYE